MLSNSPENKRITELLSSKEFQEKLEESYKKLKIAEDYLIEACKIDLNILHQPFII